jgi:hypothetical protein
MTKCETELTCGICSRVFTKNRSMTNHRRWHKIEKYADFQKRELSAHIGAKRPLETGRRIALANSAEGNGMWKGDEVGRQGCHFYAKRRLIKPDGCSRCNKITNTLDLCYKDHKAGMKNDIYTRDLNMWLWLCRSCHMQLDGRMKNLKRGR